MYKIRARVQEVKTEEVVQLEHPRFEGFKVEEIDKLPESKRISVVNEMYFHRADHMAIYETWRNYFTKKGTPWFSHFVNRPQNLVEVKIVKERVALDVRGG